MYTIFRRNIDCQCLTLLYLFLLQLGKQLFFLSPVTLEPLNYQLGVKKHFMYKTHGVLKHLCLQQIQLFKEENTF